MTLFVGSISLTQGPTTLLPRKAAAAQIAVPDWPLLLDPVGRTRLLDHICDALMLESDHPARMKLSSRCDRPGPQFLAELLCQLAVILQQIAGHPVTCSKALLLPETGSALVVWEFLLPKTGRTAGLSAESLIKAAAGPDGDARTTLSFETTYDHVTEVSKAVGNSVVEVILAAAHRRGIAWRMIDPVWPMLAFGQGSQTRRMMTTITESDGHISSLFTQDKLLSLHVLREAGFPVPMHHLVHSEEAAVAAAENLGYPVVVKPTDQMRSLGVSVRLQTADAVREAFRKAAAISRSILVETQLPGLPYRILVIGGRAQAAMQRSRPAVVGDGSSTIGLLIEKTNRERALNALKTAHGPRQINVENFKDELAPSLADQGLTLEAVPEAERCVHLAFKGETGRGGENLDVTENIHPDNLVMAEAVAEILELSVLGLDFMTEDISRSYKEVSCGINEVNAEPALSLHMSATSSPRDVTTSLFDQEFGAGGDGCIPAICTIGHAEKRFFDLLEGALELLGQKAGIAVGDDHARVGRFHLPAGSVKLRPAARILADSRVDCALVALATGDFIAGLAFDRCTACYLPRLPARDDDEALIQQAKLMAMEIADTVILPASDYGVWAERLDLAGRRLVLISQYRETTGKPDNEKVQPPGLQIRLEVGKTLKLLYHHEDHVDCLARLACDGDSDDERLEALLVATASLVAMGRQPREISRAITAAWNRHLDRCPAQLAAKPTAAGRNNEKLTEKR